MRHCPTLANYIEVGNKTSFDEKPPLCLKRETVQDLGGGFFMQMLLNF